MKKNDKTIEETFALAFKKHQENKLHLAEKLYKEILKTNPSHFESISLLGLLSAQNGNFDTAKQLIQKALNINPNHADTHYNLGDVLIELGEFRMAVNSYQKAIELKPSYANAYYNLATVLKELGELKKAANCYQRAIEIRPDHADTHNNLGIVFKELREFKKAINSYQKAVEIQPNHVNAHYNLGIAFKELGEFEKSVEFYRKTIEIQPDHAKAYNNLGIALQMLEKHGEAVASYQEALIKRSGIVTEEEKKLRPATTAFFLELTNKCNFHCEFCPSDSQTRSQGFMDLSLVKKVFDEIKQKKLVTTVQLHLMGEPTLHPKLNDILLYAKEKNIKVDLTTNGSTLVAKKIPKLLETISGRVVASLMTPTKETYKIRGEVGLNWDRYIDNFRLLVQEHLKRISRGENNEYSIIIRIMVTGKGIKGAVKVLESSNDIQENWNEWTQYVEGIEKQLGIKPFKRPKIDPANVFSLVTDTREVSYDLQKGLTIQFWRAFTFANSRVNDEYKLEFQKSTQYCPHPFTDFGVLWNGDVSLCCLDHDATLKVGDVRNNSIESVLKSAAAKKLRGSMYSLETLHPTCQKCQARPVEKNS